MAKFLGSLDTQYETLFGTIDSSNENIGKKIFVFCSQEKHGIFLFFLIDIKEFSQRIIRYLKTSQRTLALPVGEVMLNRKGRLYVEKLEMH